MKTAKRKIRQNIYGNWVGYVGRDRTVEFGTDGRAAEYWKTTDVIDFNECWSEKTTWLNQKEEK